MLLQENNIVKIQKLIWRSHIALSPSLSPSQSPRKEGLKYYVHHWTEPVAASLHSWWRRCWVCHESHVTLIAQDLVRRVSTNRFTPPIFHRHCKIILILHTL